MMKTVSRLVPAIEPYSIDECFIDLTGVEKEIPELLTAIRSRVLRWVRDSDLRQFRPYEEHLRNSRIISRRPIRGLAACSTGRASRPRARSAR